jgi:hypothetical protein
MKYTFALNFTRSKKEKKISYNTITIRITEAWIVPCIMQFYRKYLLFLTFLLKFSLEPEFIDCLLHKCSFTENT